jgi:hypothetical protein
MSKIKRIRRWLRRKLWRLDSRSRSGMTLGGSGMTLGGVGNDAGGTGNDD